MRKVRMRPERRLQHHADCPHGDACLVGIVLTGLGHVISEGLGRRGVGLPDFLHDRVNGLFDSNCLYNSRHFSLLWSCLGYVQVTGSAPTLRSSTVAGSHIMVNGTITPKPEFF